jgi:hypothetical protein
MPSRRVPMTRRRVPYTIRKTYRRPCYRVMNKRSRRVFAKCATLENARSQDRLLRGLLYNPDFKRRLREQYSYI